jgi:hypothetical protein
VSRALLWWSCHSAGTSHVFLSPPPSTPAFSVPWTLLIVILSVVCALWVLFCMLRLRSSRNSDGTLEITRDSVFARLLVVTGVCLCCYSSLRRTRFGWWLGFRPSARVLQVWGARSLPNVLVTTPSATQPSTATAAQAHDDTSVARDPEAAVRAAWQETGS